MLSGVALACPRRYRIEHAASAFGQEPSRLGDFLREPLKMEGLVRSPQSLRSAAIYHTETVTLQKTWFLFRFSKRCDMRHASAHSKRLRSQTKLFSSNTNTKTRGHRSPPSLRRPRSLPPLRFSFCESSTVHSKLFARCGGRRKFPANETRVSSPLPQGLRAAPAACARPAYYPLSS